MTTRRRILTGASVGLFLLWAAVAATASAQWQQINEDGFGTANVDSVASLAVYGGHLYAGTASPGKLYRARVETGRFVWEELSLPTRFGLREIFTYESVPYLVVADDHRGEPWIYVAARARGTTVDGTRETDVLVRLQSSDGVVFEESNVWGVRRDIADIMGVAVFGGRLLVSIGGLGPCGHPYQRMYLEGNDRIGGPPEGWGNILTDIMLTPDNYRDANCALQALAPWGDFLYGATTRTNPDGSRTAEVWRTAGVAGGSLFASTHWEKLGEFTSSALLGVNSLETFAGTLYVGTRVRPGTAGGPMLLRLRGADDAFTLEQVETADAFDARRTSIDVLQSFSDHLYAGLGGEAGAPPPAAQILRSADGAHWRDVTPADLHDDLANAHIGATTTAAEAIYFGTAQNIGAGAEVWERASPLPLRPEPKVPEPFFSSLYLVDCGPCPQCLGAEKPCDPRVNPDLDEFLIWVPGRDLIRFRRSRLGLGPEDGHLAAAAPLFLQRGRTLYLAAAPLAKATAEQAGVVLVFDAKGQVLSRFAGRRPGERLGRSMDVRGDEAAVASSDRVLRLRDGKIVFEMEIPKHLAAGRGVTVAFADDRDGDQRPEIALGTPFANVNGMPEAGEINVIGSRSGTVIETHRGFADGQHLGRRLFGRGHGDRALPQ